MGRDVGRWGGGMSVAWGVLWGEMSVARGGGVGGRRCLVTQGMCVLGG